VDGWSGERLESDVPAASCSAMRRPFDRANPFRSTLAVLLGRARLGASKCPGDRILRSMGCPNEGG
jgi:hypothetical protein